MPQFFDIIRKEWLALLALLYFFLGPWLMTMGIWLPHAYAWFNVPPPQTFPVALSFFHHAVVSPSAFIVYMAFYGGALLIFGLGLWWRHRGIYLAYLGISFFDHFAWINNGPNPVPVWSFLPFTLEMAGFLLTLFCWPEFFPGTKNGTPPPPG